MARPRTLIDARPCTVNLEKRQWELLEMLARAANVSTSEMARDLLGDALRREMSLPREHPERRRG